MHTFVVSRIKTGCWQLHIICSCVVSLFGCFVYLQSLFVSVNFVFHLGSLCVCGHFLSHCGYFVSLSSFYISSWFCFSFWSFCVFVVVLRVSLSFSLSVGALCLWSFCIFADILHLFMRLLILILCVAGHFASLRGCCWRLFCVSVYESCFSLRFSCFSLK